MNDILEEIKKNRPQLSLSSQKTYTSILKNLYKKVYNSSDIDVSKFNDDSKSILAFLKDLDINKRKTVLSALFVISKNQDYQNLMVNDAKQYNKDQENQEMTETQKENWITQEDIDDVINKYEKNVKKILIENPTEMNIKYYQYYQNYIILCIMTGKYIPPRRLKDYCDLKIKNIDEKNDNYIETVKSGRTHNKNFVFNSYKTSKFYGEQKVPLPKPLIAILNKFITYNKFDYLLTDSYGHQLTPVKLNQRLNKIFRKKVSCNLLRHSYMTDKYKNVPDLKDMLNVASSMGHSLIQGLEYVKKQPTDV